MKMGGREEEKKYRSEGWENATVREEGWEKETVTEEGRENAEEKYVIGTEEAEEYDGAEENERTETAEDRREENGTLERTDDAALAGDETLLLTVETREEATELRSLLCDEVLLEAELPPPVPPCWPPPPCCPPPGPPFSPP